MEQAIADAVERALPALLPAVLEGMDVTTRLSTRRGSACIHPGRQATQFGGRSVDLGEENGFQRWSAAGGHAGPASEGRPDGAGITTLPHTPRRPDPGFNPQPNTVGSPTASWPQGTVGNGLTGFETAGPVDRVSEFDSDDYTHSCIIVQGDSPP